MVAGLTAGAGLATIGSTVGASGVGAAEPDLVGLASRVVLAPIFEELLYRERLMVPLQKRMGEIGAIAVTSALFALPHLPPALMAQAFALGLCLGLTRVLFGSVSVCVGLHAGWNLGLLCLPNA